MIFLPTDVVNLFVCTHFVFSLFFQTVRLHFDLSAEVFANNRFLIHGTKKTRDFSRASAHKILYIIRLLSAVSTESFDSFLCKINGIISSVSASPILLSIGFL
jgi:hypothetical protein